MLAMKNCLHALICAILITHSKAGCTWCTDSCLEPYVSDGWQLVRSVGPTHTGWHPANDELSGTAVYNGDDTYSTNFESVVSSFNQFLFITGDCSIWLITSKSQAIGELYSMSSRWICSSSIQSTAYTAAWLNRGYAEDPWISTVSHGEGVYATEMLYGENSDPSYTNAITDHGGVNVYIRKVDDANDIGCIDGCDDVNCDDNDECTVDSCDASNGYPLCVYDAKDCDDNDGCTDDSCINGVCLHEAVVCNDNDLCTDDECINDECMYIDIDCDNGNICEVHSCDDTTGECVHEDKCFTGLYCDANSGDCTDIDCGALPIDEYLVDCSAQFIENENELSSLQNTVSNLLTDIDARDVEIDSRLDDIDNDMIVINDVIVAHDTDIDDMKITIDAMDTTINEINADILDINAQISSNDVDIDAINMQITDLSTFVSDNDVDIDAINTKIGVIEVDIVGLDTRVSTHDGDIASINTRIDDVDTAIVVINGDIGDNDIDIADIQSDIVVLQSAIADNSVVIDDIYTRLDGIDDDIVDIKANIALNTESIDDILQRIYDFGNSLNAAQSVIESEIMDDDAYDKYAFYKEHKDDLVILLLIINVSMMLVLVFVCLKTSKNNTYQKVINVYSSEDEQNQLNK